MGAYKRWSWEQRDPLLQQGLHASAKAAKAWDHVCARVVYQGMMKGALLVSDVLEDIHAKAVGDVAGQPPDDKWPASEDWRLVLLDEPEVRVQQL